MKATARRQGADGLTHRVEIGQHELIVDEPPEKGGADRGPAPHELLAASLASCTAITLEMYAARKGWNLHGLEVTVEHPPWSPGETARFTVELTLPEGLSEEQRERLRTIATRCPVNRILGGEVEIEHR